MAFPWIFHSNFDDGTSGFDSEADDDAILDYPNYTELARWDDSQMSPFSGAHCLRIKPAGGTNDATLTEADMNIIDTATGFFSFNILFGSDFTGTADDTFHLLELQGAASAVVTALGARVVAATGAINMGVGGLVASAVPSAFAPLDMKRNTWYTIELKANIETDASGTLDLFITEAGQASQETADVAIASVDSIAVTDGVFGLQQHLASTTGTILLDNFVMDDARIYAQRDVFPNDIMITKNQHLFIGPGTIENISLLSGAGTDCVLTVYDTDKADTNNASNIAIELKNTANNEAVDPAGTPVDVTRGAYVVISGTTPRALAKIHRAPNYSRAGYRIHGRSATP